MAKCNCCLPMELPGCVAGSRPSVATQNGAAPAGEAAPAAADAAGELAEPALRPFTRLTKAATEALRYRAEDVARSLTKSVIKEVTCLHNITPSRAISLSLRICVA